VCAVLANAIAFHVTLPGAEFEPPKLSLLLDFWHWAATLWAFAQVTSFKLFLAIIFAV